jgi:hypothetical protein
MEEEEEDERVGRFSQSPQSYLQEVRYNIRLDELYKIVDHCTMNQSSDICPIILDVVEPELEALMGMKDRQLIKIFDNVGNMLYQRSFARKKAWALFQNVFMMATEETIVYNGQQRGVITVIVFPF